MKKDKELTLFAVIAGIILAIIFGASNAYLGLRVGMTVSASIPAAVVSTAIMRIILKRKSIKENNIVQTIASAGESLAAGVIFTIPALIILGYKLSLWDILLISLSGGILGVLFLIPLRKSLLEDKELAYPEGKACAEVLKSVEQSKRNAKFLFAGLGTGMIFKHLNLFLNIPIKFLKTNLSFDFSPSLLGIGYIIGWRISSFVFSGGFIGWFVFIPLISYFIGKESSPYKIWSDYIRYIGAGGVLAGGILSLIKNLKALKKISLKTSKEEISNKFVFLGLISLFLIFWLVPIFRQNIFTSFLILIFSFLFVTVSARVVGYLGSSSNPVSGMTIATIFMTSLIYIALGYINQKAQIGALIVGSIICISAAIAGDTIQDLKTGQIVGATPKYQQIGELIGVISASFIIGGVLFMLNKTYGFGSRELPAPQANLIAIIIKGLFKGNFNPILFFSGIFLSLTIELIGISGLAFSVGLYLPLELSTTILLGGIISLLYKNREKGTLFSSGLIAGDALYGILKTFFKYILIK